MQVFNSYSEMVAGATVGGYSASAVSVFNDRNRMERIHQMIKQTKSGDVNSNPELKALVDEENAEWKALDRQQMTDEQIAEMNDWTSMMDFIRKESGGRMGIDDCFNR